MRVFTPHRAARRSGPAPAARRPAVGSGVTDLELGRPRGGGDCRSTFPASAPTCSSRQSSAEWYAGPDSRTTTRPSRVPASGTRAIPAYGLAITLSRSGTSSCEGPARGRSGSVATTSSTRSSAPYRTTAAQSEPVDARHAVDQGAERPGRCGHHPPGQLELAVAGRRRRLVPYADHLDAGHARPAGAGPAAGGPRRAPARACRPGPGRTRSAAPGPARCRRRPRPAARRRRPARRGGRARRSGRERAWPPPSHSQITQSARSRLREVSISPERPSDRAKSARCPRVRPDDSVVRPLSLACPPGSLGGCRMKRATIKDVAGHWPESVPQDRLPGDQPRARRLAALTERVRAGGHRRSTTGTTSPPATCAAASAPAASGSCCTTWATRSPRRCCARSRTGLGQPASRSSRPASTRTSSARPRSCHDLISRRVDGLGPMPTGPDQGYLRADLRAGLAIVAVDRPVAGGGRRPPDAVGSGRVLIDTVVVDNRDGARTATAHLVAHGHRRIACLTDRLVDLDRERAAGGLPAGARRRRPRAGRRAWW